MAWAGTLRRLWHNRNIPVMSFQIMKLINTGVTFTLLGHILQYYTIEFDLLEVEGKTVLGASYLHAFMLSGLLRPLIIEICVDSSAALRELHRSHLGVGHVQCVLV
jgi:hypothetical protein